MADSSPKSSSGRRSDAKDPEAKVITIGVGQVLLFALLLLVIPAGYLIGRRIPGGGSAAAGTGGAKSAAPSGASVSVTGPGGVGASVVEAPAQGGVAAPVDPSGALPGEMAPGQVIQLPESNHPLIGQDWIEISGKTLDGKPIKLSDMKGKKVMLNFWATWCPPCRIEMPFMQEAYDMYKDQGFEIFAADAGERVAPIDWFPTITTFVTNSGFTFPIIVPDDTYSAQQQYYVSSLPSTFLFSPEGKMVDSHRGMYPNRATLHDQLKRRFEVTQ